MELCKESYCYESLFLLLCFVHTPRKGKMAAYIIVIELSYLKVYFHYLCVGVRVFSFISTQAYLKRMK